MTTDVVIRSLLPRVRIATPVCGLVRNDEEVYGA